MLWDFMSVGFLQALDTPEILKRTFSGVLDRERAFIPLVLLWVSFSHNQCRGGNALQVTRVTE